MCCKMRRGEMRDDSAVSQILGRELNDVRLRASVDILLKFINLMWHLRSLQLAKFWKMIPKALFENGDQLVVSTFDKCFFTQFANILWWKVWKCFMLYSDIRLPALRSAHIRHHYCNNIANTLKMVEMSVGFLNFDIIIPTRQWFEKIENVWMPNFKIGGLISPPPPIIETCVKTCWNGHLK